MASFTEDPGYADLIARLQEQPETGQFSRYQAIPGAEESKARDLAMLKEFNQRERDNQLREKLARAMNAEMGARSSITASSPSSVAGNTRAQAAAMASIESLLRGTGALDARDIENKKIASNEGLQRSLQDMTERNYIRQDERAGKGQDLESILTDKKLSMEERVAAARELTQRRGQDITQSEGGQNRSLQKSLAEMEQGGQNQRLDKELGARKELSGEQMMNQKFMQALMAGVARGDEKAIRALREVLKSGQRSPFGRLLNSVNPFTP